MDDFGALWLERPTYTMRSPRDFLPMFQNQAMKFAPGERFEYNNSGFVLLGLIIEAISGQPYTEYVTEHVLHAAGMTDSGFFALNQLPSRTASGYLPTEDGQWRTNIFEIPIMGCADGGVFVTAPDFGRLWDGLSNHRLLSPSMTERFLSPTARNSNPPPSSMKRSSTRGASRSVHRGKAATFGSVTPATPPRLSTWATSTARRSIRTA